MQKRSDASAPRVLDQIYYRDCDEDSKPKRQRSWQELVSLCLLKLRIKRRYYCLMLIVSLLVFPFIVSEAFYDSIIYSSVVLLHRSANFFQDEGAFLFGYQAFTMEDKIKAQAVVHRGTDLECTIHDEVPLLVNLKVPRAAGSTVTDLLIEHGKSNHYLVSLASRLSFNTKNELDNREKDFTTYLTSFHHKTAQSSHVRFLDFQKFGLPEPLYIGTFRDPIERMQSHYNFDSFADRPFYVVYKLWVKGEVRVVKPTFLQCVRKFMAMNISAQDIPYGSDGKITNLRVKSALKRIPRKFACLRNKYLNVQLRYYCGYHKNCKTLETVDSMLEIATNNMERFHVVMLTSDMHTSVHLLEKMIPSYFRGSTHFYENYEKSRHDIVLEEERLRVKNSQSIPFVCARNTDSEMDRQYCACNGTVYYGREFADSAGSLAQSSSSPAKEMPMSLRDMQVSGEFLTADVTRTGGMHCSHKISTSLGGFPSDPAPSEPKQCICQPQRPLDVLEKKSSMVFHMRGSVNTRMPSHAEGMPEDVRKYLGGFLKNEIVLYDAAKKHFKKNAERCGV